ncbi:MAG TPA: sn-glycerol-1-phosphate dehydrogenase [Thermomicrobiales bacterium]|nr:sn-glycerol-1-phosphate dehydrogenase [Thermomicrobiales bacterium]
MESGRIAAALRDAGDTRRVVIGAGALDAVGETFASCFGQQAAVVVADTNTFAAAGQAVERQLRAAGHTVEEAIVFPGQPPLYADFARVLELEQQLRQRDAIPVVAGSGTLNDLTKLAAHRAGHPYLCVCTAASVDGYTAFGAAITRDGFKQTMACPAPHAVLADLAVLAAAPARLNASGYGDLLGKVTAGADWLLADALDIEPVNPRAWSLVQEPLRDWTAQPAQVHAGDQQALARLCEGLVVTGVAMQLSQSSRPASGSEHLFSHLWEMQALEHGEPVVPHGFKVGVGTLAAAALYERVLARDLTHLDIDALCRAWPARAGVGRLARQAHDLPPLAAHAVTESLAKYIDGGQLRQRLTLLGRRWPALRERLAAQLLPARHLRELLRAAGCPVQPAEVGVSLARLRESYTLARTIRRRYTVLDLVNETGILAACVDELFAPGGFWA